MKTKYLLSALAIGAAFVACNNEDFMVDEQMNVNNEIVGANLLSKGASLNISGGEDGNSRATASGWEVGKDVAGLGWVVKGQPADYQTGVQINEVGDILYNNHFFQYTEEGWNTQSNIYEGWHFAYFRYAHQSKPGALSFKVNDKEFKGETSKVDALNNAPYLSGAIFLSADNVDTTNGTIEESFNIKRIVNAVYPMLNVGEDFSKNDTLNNIAINSLTMGVKGKTFFADCITVKPAKLPEGDITSVDSLYINGALVRSQYQRAITTSLEKDMFKLDDNHEARFFMAPIERSLVKDSLYLRVDVDGGHFDIVYTDTIDDEGNPVELTAIQEMNNEALDKMSALLTEKGWYNAAKDDTVSFYNKVYDTRRFTLDLGLGLENFTADYLIKDSTDWNSCVALADALCEERPTFTLAENAQVFFDTHIAAPKKGVNVVGVATQVTKAGKLIVNGDLTWNNDISIARENNKGVVVVVNEGKKLSVVDGKLQPYRIYNYGTILANPLSTIGTNGYGNLAHNNRIEVEYGAYVYPASNVTGANIIAYEVPAQYSIAKINTLMNNGSSTKQANINTLIVGEGVDLKCYVPSSTSKEDDVTDRYGTTVGSTTTVNAQDLNISKAINLEINGGIVSSTEAKTVGNVIITEGGELNGVNVEGEYLNITEGTVECTSIKAEVTATDAEITAETITGDVVAENTEITAETITGDVTLKGTSSITNVVITGDVTVETGTTTLTDVTINGTLTNKATVTVNVNGKDDVTIKGIVNEGVMNVNTTVYVETIDLKKSTSTTIADGDYIWYTEDYEQGGTTKGLILNPTEKLAKDIAKAEAGATVTLEADTELEAALVIDKKITIDLNGKTISLPEDVQTIYQSGVASALICVNDGGELTIKNGIVNGGAEDYAVEVRGGILNIEGGEYYGACTSAYAISGTINIKDGKFKVTNPNSQWGSAYLLNKKDGQTAAINVTGGEFYNFDPSANSEIGFNSTLYTSTENAEGWYVVAAAE